MYDITVWVGQIGNNMNKDGAGYRGEERTFFIRNLYFILFVISAEQF